MKINTMILVLIFSFGTFAKNISTQKVFEKELLKNFKVNITSKNQLNKLKEKVLTGAGKSVPTLLKVMKDKTYPIKNRWMATFMLGRIAGKNAIPVVAKYAEHPNWILRIASLKTLLALKDKSRPNLYSKLLNDESLIVRTQALENVKYLKMKELGKDVWKMVFNKSNYKMTKKGLKRISIIKNAIRTVGDLGYEKSKKSMLKMVLDKKYDDVFEDLDYSLTLLTGKQSPVSNMENKRYFWNKLKGV